MRRTRTIILTVVAACAGGSAEAQFATPRRPAATAWTTARPSAETDLARRQRRWALEETRTAVAKVNFLPRTAPVSAPVQREITAYAPAADASVTARQWDAGDCERAIRKAERRYGLPPFLLAAIALTESGYKGRPNPLAMNIQGRSYFASTTYEMERVVADQGGTSSSIDVGCLQVNLRWHAARFRDWRSLLVPSYNAGYAALYLNELKARYGTWNAAVGAYHSRTPWKSANYACLVSRRWSQIFGSERPGCGADIEAMARLMYSTQGG